MAAVEGLWRFLAAQRVFAGAEAHPRNGHGGPGATEVADAALVRVVTVKTRRGLALTILPAHVGLNLRRVRDVLGDPDARPAGEGDLRAVLGDGDPGAGRTFDRLSEIAVYVEDGLAARDRIAFAAGKDRAPVAMKFAEFARVVQPRRADLGAAGAGEPTLDRGVQHGARA